MMKSLWHELLLGVYSPKDGYINLNYRNLFLDPLKAELTFFHEQVHRFLTKMTDFGQATSVIFQASESLRKIAPHDLTRIKQAIYKHQIFVQEGTASLIEAIHLKRLKGKDAVLSWARDSLPLDYQRRLNELLFVLDLEKEKQDRFTGIIPIYALHTIIRKRIVELDLMRNSEKFVQYLETHDNNPDIRFEKLISVIKKEPDLLDKPPSEICSRAGVSFHADLSKHECAAFMTYLAQFTDEPRTYLPADIGDAPDSMAHLVGAIDEMVIGGFDLKHSMLLTDVADLLHYQDVAEALVVFGLGEGKAWQREYQKQIGVKPDGLIIAFQKTGEKYHLPLNKESIANLLTNEFKKTTLVVKWGLYKVGENCLDDFPSSRRPDVVIYNTVKNLGEQFDVWFTFGHNAEYMFIGSSEDHPFQTLIIKDENGVLHYVNSFGNKSINDFRKKYKANITQQSHTDFLDDSLHLTNALSLWMGLPWEIDWYKSMSDIKNPKETLIYRE